MAERCDSCRLWRRLTAESGECHAVSPQPVLYLNIPGDTTGPLTGVPATAPPPGGLRVVWPRTCPADFCGEWSPLPVRPQRPDRPRKVCLCGSTRFKAAFIEQNFRETMNGHIVLTVGWFSHSDGDIYTPTASEKAALDELHLRKIDDADEVLVLNVGGYVGDSTRREIAYAQAAGKPVRYLEPPESCHAGRDGDCNWAPCPQERDGEPAATGRHCPLDTHDPDLEGR